MKHKSIGILLFLCFSLLSAADNPEQTCFQTAGGWRPELDLRSDVAIVYGVNRSFAERAQSWRERGYGIHLMTGVAWGGYQDYLDGRFDGKKHWDEGQVQRNGEMIMHGVNVPYMVPTQTYVDYLKSLVKTAIDAGVTAIHLEEPEFWNRGGYSEGFKREWQAYYGEPWQAQHESPEATYRSAKLKYHLYFRALKDIFQFAKDYSESKGDRVRCYVPTHTLINYSAWQIVSPESSLSNLPGMDGYIGQVWTGTARTPVIYEGVEKERTFENAFLEYGSMRSMTRPTGRRVYFLTDPIEDNPDHTWEDYKKNYEATFTAQLMYPDIFHYEVMPWPSRIFLGSYMVEGATERQKIPPDYATEILTLINTLNDMRQEEHSISGVAGIGVLLSDTMMFQRFPTHGEEDRLMSNFYGMALPFLKHGIPIQLVQMENLPFPDTLKDIRVLIMSYANMKPLNPAYHEAIAKWVKAGGALLYLGRDEDPYQTIREWWNQDGNKYNAPSDHLFELLGLPADVEKQTGRIEKGFVTLLRKNPKEIALQKGGGEELRGTARNLLQLLNLEKEWRESNVLHVRRGPYDIVAVLDESMSAEPYRISGPVVDLFDPELPVLPEKIMQPGERHFLLSLNRWNKESPCVLASAARVSDEQRDDHSYSFTLKGPAETWGVARILLPAKPQKMDVTGPAHGEIGLATGWDDQTNTLLIRFRNNPDGVRLSIDFSKPR
ncbi:MAG: hypothetical protein C4527_05270 [Candidatus Omnitrophota bacterium]|nr:MAG: hypothetical protein C4527_05270 [Candidatus Omnitrophota bacterium]